MVMSRKYRRRSRRCGIRNVVSLSRRHFLTCASTIAITLGLPACSRALPRGTAIASYPTGPATASEVPENGHVDDVALISGQATGPKSADLFSGFTSPASTVTLKSGTKFLTRTDGLDKLLLSSSYSCLDSEISTWMQKGIAFLRMSNGRGIFFSANVSDHHDLRVGIVTGLDETGLFEGNGTLYNAQIIDLSKVPGWTVSYKAGDLYTFGCAGLDIYVKYRGVEILRYKEWRHVVAGRAAIWQQGQGIPDTTIRYVPATLLGSNRALQYFDIRDFGAKTTMTKGTISGRSNFLAIEDPAGLAIGDHVVVEIGGESGAGARGTLGVGGAWPSLSYVNSAAMNADTGQPDRTYAWDRSSGLVYIYTSGSWSHRDDGGGPFNQGYYTAKALPKALLAKIMAIAGNVVTLDTAATVTATGATVYVDCANCFNVLTDSLADNLPATPNVTIGIPAGSFAIGKELGGTARPGITISGRGKGVSTLFSPKGTICVSLVIDRSAKPAIRDLTMIGNHGTGANPDGFQLVYHMGVNDFYTAWPTTCGMTACTNGTFTNVAVQNVLSYAVSHTNSIDCWAYNCDLKMSASLKQYTQWFFEAANAVRGGFVDCSATGPSLMKCFETFNGDSVQFISCGGQNVLASANSSGGYLFEGFYSTITTGSYDNIGAGFFHEPVLNVNANAYPTDGLLSKGGTIKNPRIIQTGFTEPINKETIPAIQIQPACVNVTVSGQYPNGSSPFSSELGGYFQSPDYAVVSPQKVFASVGAIAVHSDAANTTIIGIRSVGSARRGHGGVELGSTATGSRIIDCVTDAVVVIRDTEKKNIQTNAGLPVYPARNR
jgi:hypothetical protein